MACRLRIESTPYYFEIKDSNDDADIVVGIPCFTRPVHPRWVSAVQTIQFPSGMSHKIVAIQGTNQVRDYTGDYGRIGPARDHIVKEAIKAKAKYLFFIDDDTQVPNDAILKTLLGLKKKFKRKDLRWNVRGQRPSFSITI